jgi:hypothetical protein
MSTTIVTADNPKETAINCMMENRNQLISLFFEIRQFHESVDDLPTDIRDDINTWVNNTLNCVSFNFGDAVEILNEYKDYRPTDNSVWENLIHIEDIATCQAAYTIKAVTIAYIEAMMKALSDLSYLDFQDYWGSVGFDYENTDSNEAQMKCLYEEKIKEVDILSM